MSPDRIDLYEPYAVKQRRQDVKNSMQQRGEECVVFKMFHPTPDRSHVKCPACYGEAYSDSKDSRCTRCYGTGIDGGIKQLARAWAMFGDSVADEKIGKRGHWASDSRQMHLEYRPTLLERDYVARVRRWSQDHRPLELEGFYIVGAVTAQSLRTGGRFGQSQTDLIGQIAQVQKVSTSLIINSYPLVGQRIERLDGKPR